MTTYLGCDAARDLLQPFVDAELPMAAQIDLEAHLRWCDVCAARVEDLQTIGAGLRTASAAPGGHPEDERALAVLQSEVLTRIRAEHDQSWTVRVRDLCADMRFFWPALGATAAVALCLAAATAVNRVMRAEYPLSMADRLSALANPGSDRHPVPLDAGMLAPRPIGDGSSLERLPADEAVFALAAVVTREGRIANFELLGPDESAHVAELLEAVRQSRFTPARTPDGAVAVNMVWLLTRTTVKASVDPADTGMLAPIEAPSGAEVVKPISAERPRRPLRPARS